MDKKFIANLIINMSVGDTFDFQFPNNSGDTIYAAASCINVHDLNRVIVSAYGRNEYDRLISDFDSIENIENKLDFLK